MSKMDEKQLLDLLVKKEESAGSYVFGQLGDEREASLRQYHRLPYGNEEEGWSQIVASDIQDTVEWILPSLLKTFTMTDRAVSFEATRADQVESAAQATDACNYVFFKQNNGFLVLYNAFKDGLTIRNSATMWRKEDVNTVSSVPFKNATHEMLALLLQEAGEKAEITSAKAEPQMTPPQMVLNPFTGMPEQGKPQPVLDEFGEPVMVYTGRIKKVEKKTVIKVESFSPEDLLVDRNWTSPLLDDCPYVCREMRVTLTDLKMMGYDDVTAEELRDGSEESPGGATRLSSITQTDNQDATISEVTDDDSMAEGWLRMEYVLVDFDGDGIAERRRVYRLKDRILTNEVCAHVPIATFSPILNPHRWDGMSMSDVVADLQKLHTELLRQNLNNQYLTNSPRKKVLTDANWLPYANIDDLLDSRPGGIIRQRQQDAVTDEVTPFVAGATLPMLEYVQGMRENRTGVSRTSMGLNPDALNNTLGGRQIDVSAAAQRVELIARIGAELLLKPIMRGILHLLTDGEMERVAFQLRGKFVEYDPNEWRDQYDMTSNVGLGTGDRQMQAQSLQTVMQSQIALMPYGLVTPQHLYHTETKIIENAGFKDVQNFVQAPQPPDPNAPKEPPLPLQIEQMKGQVAVAVKQKEVEVEDQQHQREMQRDIMVENAKQEAQARDALHTAKVDADKELQKAALAAQEAERQRSFDKWKEELKASTAIYLANIKGAAAVSGAQASAQGEMATAEASSGVTEQSNALATSMAALQAIIESLNQPKMIIKDSDGRPIGIGPQPKE